MSKLLVDEISDADNTGPVTVTDGLTVQGAFTSLGIDDNATSTAITLDASGNLLVGTTTTDGGYDESDGGATTVFMGASIGGAASGSAFVSRRAAPLQLNRQANDGDIAVFRKNGTTVGSIGIKPNEFTVESDTTFLTFLTGGLNDGIAYRDDATARQFRPYTTKDGDIDLGADGARWKDLYLSGGVYLGGTVAANKLDDYEEGTWLPTVSAASGSYTSVTASGKYIKVGRSVTIRMRVFITTNGTAAGAMFLGNIPFPTTDSTDWGGGTREDVGTGDGYVFSGQGTTSIYINKYDGTYGLTSGRGFTFCISYIAA